jgi:hypothetical protein
MVKQASKWLLVDGTGFWVLCPRISGGRVTGLGTLFAGAYIGTDPGHSTSEKRDFVGLDTPQIVTSDVPGRRFVLGAEDLGSIDVGSPIYFRGLSAGEVVATDVAPDGKEVLVTVFVSAPYDRFVTTDSRFWNASGIDLTLDASGVRLNTQSLATVIVGGIAFDTPMEPAAGPPMRAEANSNFVLWPDRANALKPRETVVEQYAMRFPQSVRGLQAGAQVDFRGVTIGEVSSIDLEYDPVRVDFKTAVRVRFFPERLQPRSYKAAAASNELADARQRADRHPQTAEIFGKSQCPRPRGPRIFGTLEHSVKAQYAVHVGPCTGQPRYDQLNQIVSFRAVDDFRRRVGNWFWRRLRISSLLKFGDWHFAIFHRRSSSLLLITFPLFQLMRCQIRRGNRVGPDRAAGNACGNVDGDQRRGRPRLAGQQCQSPQGDSPRPKPADGNCLDIASAIEHQRRDASICRLERPRAIRRMLPAEGLPQRFAQNHWRQPSRASLSAASRLVGAIRLGHANTSDAFVVFVEMFFIFLSHDLASCRPFRRRSKRKCKLYLYCITVIHMYLLYESKQECQYKKIEIFLRCR